MNRYFWEEVQVNGLAEFYPEIEQVALPSIRLELHSAQNHQLRPGTTKFGGLPDLVEGYVWPTYQGAPLPFVVQINLAEVAPYDTEHLLPPSGLLAFFFDVDAFFEAWPRDRTTWAVLYMDTHQTPFQDVVPVERSPAKIYQQGSVTFAQEITLPDYSCYDRASLQRLPLHRPFTEQEESAYHRLQVELADLKGKERHVPVHRLLGHADPVQWDMYDQLPEGGKNWQLLLQVDSDSVPETEWGDTGRIYFWIRADHLAHRDFSQVELLLQSS